MFNVMCKSIDFTDDNLDLIISVIVTQYKNEHNSFSIFENNFKKSEVKEKLDV